MEHGFEVTLTWDPSSPHSGGTIADYSRTGEANSPGHPAIVTSAATGFGGDKTLWNPEELLLTAIAQCHMLSFLYVAHQRGIEILDYVDTARATMEYSGGRGAMTRAVLHLHVRAHASHETLTEISEAAEPMCVLRASVNFPIEVQIDVS